MPFIHFDFQFILPITLISWAHHAIKQKLQKLPSWSNASTKQASKKYKADAETSATNGCGGGMLIEGNPEGMPDQSAKEEKKWKAPSSFKRLRGSLTRPEPREMVSHY